MVELGSMPITTALRAQAVMAARRPLTDAARARQCGDCVLAPAMTVLAHRWTRPCEDGNHAAPVADDCAVQPGQKALRALQRLSDNGGS